MPSLWKRLKAWEKSVHNSYVADISTPENLKRARFYMRWLDHEVLRVHWTNLYEIAPGVWRSNHPTEKRFRAYKEQGINTILNLRGAIDRPFYSIERQLCDQIGLDLHSVSMQAKIVPKVETMKTLIHLLRTLPRPFLMHCKSGADRTGLASAVYLLVIEGKPLAEAQKMLSRRFVHFDNRGTGVLDHILRCYGVYHAATGQDFETWLDDGYDPAAITADHLSNYNK